MLRQCQKWLIEESRLSESAKIRLRLAKPEGTDRHCWRPEEVTAMIAHCRGTPGLGWLGDAVTALSLTGLRISELNSLRWGDVDLAAGVIRLADESARRPNGRELRATMA